MVLYPNKGISSNSKHGTMSISINALGVCGSFFEGGSFMNTVNAGPLFLNLLIWKVKKKFE